MKENTVSIGNSGEYFVAAELERRGFTAAVPMSNTKDFDILAINRETQRQIAIQVKTNRGKGKQWILNKKSEELQGDNIYYVLISLNELEYPEYYIVESKLVAKSVTEGYKLWIQNDGKNGKHQETPMRKFTFNSSKYDNILCLKAEDFKDNWDKLK